MINLALAKLIKVFIVSLDSSKTTYTSSQIPSNLFMGFGYNPELEERGERLDMLVFFNWMKFFQNSYNTNLTIFDASGYAIVNRTPQKKVIKLGDKPTGNQILEVLVAEQDRPKREGFRVNCELRSKYLQKLIEVTGIQASYIDSRILFRESQSYSNVFDVALEFVERLNVDNPSLVNKIQPSNSNPASKFYLPLEIAEAIYLQETKGVNGKFGPTTEEYFDEAILGLFEEKGVSYQALRCKFGPRKPGYLGDRNVLSTRSSNMWVKGILDVDPGYRDFVEGYLQPFRKNGEQLEKCVIRMKNQLNLREEF